MESFCKQLYTQALNVALWVLASFSYDVPVGHMKEEVRFRLWAGAFQREGCQQHLSEVPNYLAREASAHLVTLLLSGFHAEGWVLLFLLHVC